MWVNEYEPHPWVKVVDGIVIETANSMVDSSGLWYYVGHKSITPEKGWVFKNNDIVKPTKYCWIRVVDETVVSLHYFKDLKKDDNHSNWFYIPDHVPTPKIGWKFKDSVFQE